jgi:DNA polymerase III alpha subunit
MAEKIKRNDYGDCVFSEDYLLDLLYQDPDLDISKLYIENIEQYSNALAELGLDLPQLQTLPKNTISLKEFDRNNTEHWHMPAQYETIDVEQWLLDKCTSDVEKQRVTDEMLLFKEKGFTKVLQFLIFLVDTLRLNNIVWGVGRGSSVSSFCLFLIGVHKINPLVYDLDHREFLR